MEPPQMAGEIERRYALPFYSQLRAILVSKVEDEWSPGHELPSEAKLCQDYCVSRTVVR